MSVFGFRLKVRKENVCYAFGRQSKHDYKKYKTDKVCKKKKLGQQ